jgi:hypothetical protein
MWLHAAPVTVPRRILLISGVLALLAAPASAQGVFDTAGTRALGLAGAFVGVANDSTAVHWNPSGLAGGPPVGVTIGWHHFQLGNPDGAIDGKGSRGRTTLTSVAAWPLGLSYGSFEKTTIRDEGETPYLVQRLSVRHAGVTVLQTLHDGLVVGSTVRLLRAETAWAPAVGETLGQVLATDVRGNLAKRTTIDADLGLMASASRARVGLTVRNLRSIAVGAMPRNVALPRQARIGLAILPFDGLTLATDLDLNTVDLMGDLRRMSALGAEISLGSRLLVRSGVRWNLAISSGPAGAVGASVMVRRGLWLDAHFAQGGADEARQVSVAFRGGL